jgi:hypothetical protein
MMFTKLGNRDRLKDEDGLAIIIEVILALPIAVALIGLILNTSFQYQTAIYTQQIVNNGASYTAAASGDFETPYIPNGGVDLKPSEYVSQQVLNNPLITEVQSASCRLVNTPNTSAGYAEVQDKAVCEVRYKGLVFPTDPITVRAFNVIRQTVGEDILQTACNPNFPDQACS